MGKSFTWGAWNYDWDGEAYIVAKSECQEAADVPGYIIEQDSLDPKCELDMVVEEGWCRFQCRSDWFDVTGSHGQYVVEKVPHMSTAYKGRRGWFPVWIVRKGEWY